LSFGSIPRQLISGQRDSFGLAVFEGGDQIGIAPDARCLATLLFILFYHDQH
jgi:hypothetical protein